jgi:flagellin-like hook-associated protein FlgL
MDDAGGLAVSMKLGATQKGLASRVTQVDNAMSFLQVQQGAISTVASIIDRISELKTQFTDVTKNSSDLANYNAEFEQLAKQLEAIQSEKFNGISLFSAAAIGTGGLNGATQMTVYGSADASQQISISRTVINVEDVKQIIEAGKGVAKGIGGLTVVNIGESDAVAQVETLTIGGRIAQGDVFSISIREQTSLLETESDTTITYTATAADEAAADPQQNIRDALINAINGNATLSNFLKAAAGNTNTLTLTSNTAGDPFTVTSAGSTGSTGSISRTTNQANVVAVAQVDTYNFNNMTVGAGDTISMTLNGVTINTGALAAGASTADIATALNTAIGASTQNGILTASDGGGGSVLITANTAGTTFTSGNVSTTIGIGNTTANVSAVAQVDTLNVVGAGVISAGDTISVQVQGNTVTTAAFAGGETAAQVRDAIRAAVNLDATVSAIVTASDSGASGFTLTADTAGTAFTVNSFTLNSAGGGSVSNSTTTANVSAVAQVDTLNYPAANLATASTLAVTVNGTTYTTGAIAAGASSATVATAIATAIGAEPITVADGGGGNITFTANTAGTPFTLTNITTTALSSTTTANVVAQKQRETVTIGADSTAAGGGQIAVGDAYSVTVAGTTLTSTATAGQTASNLRDDLITKINAAGLGVTATAGGAGEVVVEANVAGTGFAISQSASTSADSLSSATTTANVSPFSLTKSLKQLGEMLAFNGAEQSQLQAARGHLSTNQVNFQQANSRIIDVDVATESAFLARSQIRAQAVQGLLSQANISAEAVLLLLQ